MKIILLAAQLTFELWSGSPGEVAILRCDGTTATIGWSTYDLGLKGRTITLDDYKFYPDATQWDKDRIADLLEWAEYCRHHNGCLVRDHYDPPMPPKKCPAIS